MFALGAYWYTDDMCADATWLELCLGGMDGAGIQLASSHHLPAGVGAGSAPSTTLVDSERQRSVASRVLD